MKARVKTTGEIVTITGTDGICLTDENGNYHLIRDLEGCEAMPDYWEKLLHQYAGMVTQGLLTNLGNTVNPDYIVEEAKAYATALVEELKKEKKRN